MIAHEYGHHISDLTGTLAKAQSAGQRHRAEVGAGAARAAGRLLRRGRGWPTRRKDPNSPIQAITQDDLDRAVDAARAVGDDRIQMQSTGQVSPESWTHGSSAMRKKWLAVGLQLR